MRDKTVLSLVAVLIITSFSCNRALNKKSLTKKGFIIFDKQNYWHFVPVESMDTSSCFDDLESSKLGKGFQFDRSKISNVSFVERTLDTMVSDVVPSRYLKIAAVEIQFCFEKKYSDLYESEVTDAKWNFKYKDSVKGKLIEFTYNVFPVNIERLKPIFCLNKKQNEIGECNCEHKNGDVNDYIFKVCSYIKKSDPYSLTACHYKIKGISTDTLDGRVVTRVELSGYSLGDIAYFDVSTKDIISISFSAR